MSWYDTLKRREEQRKRSSAVILRSIKHDLDEEARARRLNNMFNSVEYKTSFEQRNCIQPLHKLEMNFEKAVKSKNPNAETIENAKSNLIKGLNTSSINTVGRIIAEIKQECLKSSELIKINLSDEDFYSNFKRVCEKNLENFSIEEENLNCILKPYLEMNVARIKKLSDDVGNNKALNKLNENIEIIKQTAVKQAETEDELSL